MLCKFCTILQIFNGHGFHQFSHELFFLLFKNGYKYTMFLNDYSNKHKYWFEIKSESDETRIRCKELGWKSCTHKKKRLKN